MSCDCWAKVMQSLSKLTSSMRNYIYLDNEINSMFNKIKSYNLVEINASYYKEKNKKESMLTERSLKTASLKS